MNAKPATVEQKIEAERALYATWASMARLGIYDIADDHIRDFTDRIAALNKKAAKFGTRPIVVKILGTRIKEQTTFLGPNDIYPESEMIRVHHVVLYGETPKLGGWSFVATVQHVTDGENIVRQIPGAVAAPKKFFSVAPVCDHCGTKRRRKDTYICYNAGTDEWKQVGRNCLRDFTGVNNPHVIAQRAAFLEEVLLVARGFSNREGRSPAFYTSTFLAYVAEETRLNGFMSRARANATYTTYTTADLALDNMIKTAAKSQYAPTHQPTDADKARAAEVIAWVRGGMGTQPGDRDSFQLNLIATLRIDHITSRETGIAAAAFVAYQKWQEARVAAPVLESNYVGTPGDKITLTNIRCTFNREVPGFRGAVNLHKFVDDAGNVYTWFASNESLDVDSVYSGKATIKKHDDYNGVKQTIITRAKLAEVK